MTLMKKNIKLFIEKSVKFWRVYLWHENEPAIRCIETIWNNKFGCKLVFHGSFKCRIISLVNELFGYLPFMDLWYFQV